MRPGRRHTGAAADAVRRQVAADGQRADRSRSPRTRARHGAPGAVGLHDGGAAGGGRGTAGLRRGVRLARARCGERAEPGPRPPGGAIPAVSGWFTAGWFERAESYIGREIKAAGLVRLGPSRQVKHWSMSAAAAARVPDPAGHGAEGDHRPRRRADRRGVRPAHSGRGGGRRTVDPGPRRHLAGARTAEEPEPGAERRGSRPAAGPGPLPGRVRRTPGRGGRSGDDRAARLPPGQRGRTRRRDPAA